MLKCLNITLGESTNILPNSGLHPLSEQRCMGKAIVIAMTSVQIFHRFPWGQCWPISICLCLSGVAKWQVVIDGIKFNQEMFNFQVAAVASNVSLST